MTSINPSFLPFFKFLLVLLLIVGTDLEVFSQISVPISLCKDQQFKVESNSAVNVVETQWDFCEGDLLLVPQYQQRRVPDFNIPVGASLIKADNKWYGFVCSQSNNSLIRIDFGGSLSNPSPSVVNLGNLGGMLNSPQDVQVMEYQSNYYAFVFNISANKLVRINLGSNIETLTATSVAVLTGGGFGNGGMEIVHDGTQWIAALTNSNSITLANLGASPITIPTVGDILTTGVITGISATADIKFVKEGGIWYGFVVGYSSFTLHQLTFGASLYTNPTSSNLYTFAQAPYGLSINNDNGSWIMHILTLQGNLLRINFGSLVADGGLVFSNLGTLGGLNNLLKLDMALDGTRWYMLTAAWNSKNYTLFEFPEPPCHFSQSTSLLENDILQASGSGFHQISLFEKNSDGFKTIQRQVVEVLSTQAPNVNFSTTSICEDVSGTYSIESNETIVSASWIFEGNGSSTLINPVVQYNTPGIYTVEVDVLASTGCGNMKLKDIQVYEALNTPSFTSPPGLICTNNEFTFVNNTIDNFDGNLTYEWFVNDLLESDARDFIVAFNSEGDQNIKLKTSIPGCSSELTQTLFNVQTGPVVGFNYTGKCEEEAVVFTNASSGSISGYQWDFDNGNTSMEVSPSEIYSAQGNYDVSLVTTGTNGCISTTTKPVTIYSKPQPNFSIDLPPFSCSGSPSQFNDLTPPLTDSNITSRIWSFGDAGNGISIQTNPAYTYSVAGDYLVSLGMTSNYGCSNTTQKTVTISPSPVVNFTNTPACLNQATQFTDASGSDVKTWLWSIQSSTYSTQNAVHTFNVTGTQTTMLTVTGNNNCISQLSKQIEIPVPVATDFTSQSTCATKPSIFTALNAGGVDPAVAWAWDFAGQQGSGSPAQHVFSKVGSYPVKLSATRQSGCVYSVTKSINITQPPVADFTMNPESGGAPLTVSFMNKSLSATKYVWKFNDVNNSTSTEFSPSFVFDQLGTYPVELIASNSIGCSDSVKKDVQVVVPQINAVLSELRLTKSADGTFRATVTLENEGNIAIVNPEVYLDLSGLIQVKEMFLGTISPNQSLTRTLTASILPVNLSYACAEVFITGDSNSFDDRECTNLEDEVIFIQPYPNPADDVVYLDWINQDVESMQVIIYNSLGQAVLNQTYSELLPGLNQVQVEVSQLGPGIYIASYTAGSVSQSLRFSVVR